MNRRLFCMFLVLCMIVTILPVSAMAEEIHTIGTSIEEFEMLGLLTAEATVTIEQGDAVTTIQDAIQTELEKSEITTVVVNGSKTDADQKLELTIPDSKTVQWEAEYKTSDKFGVANDALINLTASSAGTLEITALGSLDGGPNQTIYSLSSSTEIVVKGTVQGDPPGSSMSVINSLGNVTVDGGTVKNSGGGTAFAVINARGANKTVVVQNGGKVIAAWVDYAISVRTNVNVIVTGTNSVVENTSTSMTTRGVIGMTAGAGTVTIQNNGRVTANGNGAAISSDNSVMVDNATVENTSVNSNMYAVIQGGEITIQNGGRVTASGNYSAISSNRNITVTGAGSVVQNTSTTATVRVISSSLPDHLVTVSDGGTVTAKGSQPAILSYSNVTVQGGKVTAANGSAIILLNYSFSPTVDIKDGGLVFSPQGMITKTTIDSDQVTNNTGGGVILKAYYQSIPDDPSIVTVTGTGILIGWDKAQGQTTYGIGTTSHIAKLSQNDSDTTVWANEDGESGIRYTNGTNTGFIPLDVTVGNHTVTFNPNGGTVGDTSRSVASGTAVGTLPTPTRSGSYRFDGWYTAASGGTKIFASTIVSANVIYYAHWTYSGGGGSTDGSGSSLDDNSSPVIVTLPAPDKPNSPTQGEIKVPGTVDGKGNVTVSITDKTVTDAFNKALAEAMKNGTEQNGITVVLRVDTGNKTGSNVKVNLPKAVQDTIIEKKIVNTIVVVDNPDIRVGMDLATVKEINKQAKSDVNITASRTDSGKLTAEAKKVIGSRPVFDLKVNYGNGKVVSNFGAGSVSVTIPYTLGANEKAGNVQAVYVDSKGKVHWLVNSVYDSLEKVLRFSTNHFSIYGIGYQQANIAFTDIAGHWAKKDIEFVVNRGLIDGTSATAFSPNMAMTRGMFVTALGRLANADMSGYEKSSFSDVKSDAYYMGYIEWANENNIMNGVGNGKFAPDQSITREQMAVIMSNYAKTISYTLPKVHVEKIFADHGKISTYAKKAVKQMQMAGVIRGKSRNFFAQRTATRAEVSAVLRRFVDLGDF